MSKIILFVDGDNIDESYTQKIFEEAQDYGEVYEAHCFSDFLKRKQRWEEAYSQYKMQLHYIPGSEKQKGKPDPNTSDIAMTVLAIEKLYELPELETCIVVANDKDYIPLAKAVREKFHKKAVMFYTQQNDKAVNSYDEAVLLQEKENAPTAIKPAEDPEIYGVATFCDLLITIEDLFKNSNEVLLANLGPILKNDKHIHYDSLGDYLKKMFNYYSLLNDNYVLKLGDKRDRIERVA
ncbi:MAG: NYN domain-containing protein [Clostridia bacterium]|nr:NYN domain-containing protein [Clostridia bacterium]